ncbi:hypothetical protein IU459_01895 [Nocardia amamiensis]|uniref:Phage tail protein n=1 Tax=Nocardia amamiensis TaxID=404578 RepID=A0ABS0CNF4_9NOCA|nr:hypothetical protein [Nocardia amamiensis]MBF6296293.1 hypothetical protein [Nocardia amamiensis]
MSTVGDYFASTAIRGIDEGIGTRGVVQAMHGTPSDGSLELMTGTPGPQGEQGDAARPFRWEGDIADHTALTALAAKLTTAHAGKAWRVVATDTLVYWNGRGFDSFAQAFGAHGPDGETCTVSIGTVDTGPVGSELQVTVVGEPPDLVLNLTVPRGVQGRKGDPGGPGPLRNAPDYADGIHADGAVPVWDDTIGKWKPRPYPGLRGPWSIVEGQAWDGGAGFAASQLNIATATKTVAQLNIPAQDVAWRPIVTGGVVVGTTEAWNQFTTRVDAEVRIGTADGPIVALGAGMVTGADSYNRFQPFYATRGLTPDSAVGVVAAGQAVTLYVVLRRNAGSSNYDYSMSRARIVCMARPVGAL